MYWVFNKQQADKAIADYVEQNCADGDEAQAMAGLLRDFLISEPCIESGMVKGDPK